MNNLLGSKTLGNLMKAFAGESQARNRYTFYSSIANKENFKQIEAIFLETASNEKEHAEIFFSHIVSAMPQGEDLTIRVDTEYPVELGTTLQNLNAAANGEKAEGNEIYPLFEKEAREEGLLSIADSFKEISEIEKRHEARFRKLLYDVSNDKVFKKDTLVEWKCMNCGYIYKGKEVPDQCPACKHGKEYFELFVENY